MFSDPLSVKQADVITASGGATSYPHVGNPTNNTREYRAEGSDATYNFTNTVRASVFPNGTDAITGAPKYRYVVSKRVQRWITATGVLVNDLVTTISFSGDGADETLFTNHITQLCHLLVNTTDGGLLSRMLDGEH